jgi:hypothetical protein
MATQAQVKAFIAVIAPLAQKEYKAGKKILPSVCIAQACCESAYGTSKKMIKANAVFGFKVGKSKVHFGNAWHDKAYSTATSECYDGKTYTKITDMFRAYDCIADAVTDYYDLLTHASRYKAAVGAASALATIQGIQKAPYATSPTYVNTIMSIINSNNLTQYDRTAAVPAKITTGTVALKIGSNYTLQANMYVRDAAGGSKKKFTALTANAQQCAIKDNQGYGILKKDTEVTVQAIKIANSATWVQIPSGWICAVAADKRVYLK